MTLSTIKKAACFIISCTALNGCIVNPAAKQKEPLEASTINVVAEKYQADWSSLAKHKAAPEWLKDAKLGLYFHWGPYTVPAVGNEWYPRWMHFPKHNMAKQHLANYGSVADAPYHDFVKDFTGEHFNAGQWADLFLLSGAKFAGPVAEHHDGFAMWDSAITPWNAKDKGPKKDILGELFTELKKRDIKTIATFHHAKNLQRYQADWQKQKALKGRGFSDSHYPYLPGLATASNDPELALLYGNMPEQQWLAQVWLGKLKEVINKYQPDIVWFDSWLDQIPENYRQQFSSYYLNAAQSWHKEVAIVRKQDDLPLSFTINDHEKSREPQTLPNLWMTDDTISTGSWSYTKQLKIKPFQQVLHALIDTVSKNGVVLLNISPTAQGVIPSDQRQVLAQLGQWLKENGEAIYQTRPWLVAAQGPTIEPEGGFKNRKAFSDLAYSYQDIRYTRSKNNKTVYATTLGTPPATTQLILNAFSQHTIAVSNVSTLAGESLAWSMTEQGLLIELGNKITADAMVFKISIN